MTIRELLQRDLGQKIEPVVKVYDRAHLAEDLRQFVITDSLARELRKFFDAFTESLQSRIRGGRSGDSMAVWISGFFGSGKSHVAKVIGYLLEDSIVEPDSNRRAIDLFKLHLDDPTLPGAADLRASLAEIRTHAWCKTIAFEIKSKLDQANPESVTEACLRSFYESLGFAPTIWLARLERKLQSEGYYDDFLRIYQEQSGREWREDRLEHGFYLDEMTAALAATLGRSPESAHEMIAAYREDHARVTPEGFVRELVDYLDARATEAKPREPHIIFVIDEMGQFIADSSDRIHELQSIIEQAGTQGRGRIWFICTAQEALDQVVDRTGLKLSQLGKLDARFSVKIPLTSEDIRRVVQERLLRKRQKALPQLQQLYEEKEGIIADLCALPIERRLADVDRERFSKAYPFLPITIPLVQELFNAMRGFKLSGTERSMIGVAQGALRHLADRPLGSLVSLDVIFDQEMDELSSSDYLGTTGIKLIRESDPQIPDTPIPPSHVLKALWLISRVEWVPRTPETLAKLLADRLEVDLPQLRGKIEETLERLQRAGLVGREEATGQYRYLSEQERGLEEEIADEIRRYGVGVAKRRATQILKKYVLTRAKWGDFKIPFGTSGIIPFSLILDEEPIPSGGGEIIIQLYSPLARVKFEEIERENLAHGTRGRVIRWIAAEEQTLIEKLKRLEALERVPEKSRWRGDRSDETIRLLNEKKKEGAELEARLAALLEACLKRGRLYYAGETIELDGNKDLKVLAAEFVGVVAGHLYTRFAIGDKHFNEGNIPAYLNPKAKDLDKLDPELGLFDAEGNLIHSAPLVEAIFDELTRRKDEELDLDGKALGEHFQKIPFGWPDKLVRLVLAALFRGGAIYLEPPDSDQPVYDVTEPRADGVFTKPQKFRKTRFYPTEGGLTPSEIKQAKEALIALGELSVPDSAHGLAERVCAFADRLIREAEKVRQRVQDLQLPLSEVHLQVETAVQQATAPRDPVACIRRFLESHETWQEIKAFLDAYTEFVEQKRDEAFRSHTALIDYAHNVPEVFEGEEGVKAKRALEEFDAIIEAREILPKWKALQEAALTVVDRYRTVYARALRECAEDIGKLKHEVESSEAFKRLEESRREAVLAAYFGPEAPLAVAAEVKLDTAADLLRASRHHKVSELAALRKALVGYRHDILERCTREWAEQQQQETGKAPERKIYRLSTSERLAGKRFTTEAEFEAFWGELGREIQDKLAEGYEVEIDE